MMKTEVTRKQINKFYDEVYRAGYCDLQNIFRYEEPRFYNHGVYGWNFDVYTDHTESGDSVAFTTGYRNMTGERIPSELLKRYDEAAREILKNSFAVGFEETKKALDENRAAFIAELTA